VTGLPATGKSTIARKLAKKLRGTVLSTDKIRKRIISRPTYTREEKELVYRVMFLTAEYLLRSGATVVLDGTFYLRRLRKRVYSLAAKTRSRLVIVECTCPEEVIRRRMERRAGRTTLSDADYEVYKKIKQLYEPIQRGRITVDTSRPLRHTLAEVLSRIQG
jgi:predicted kinase